jgi:hypothetical protein
LGVLLFCVLITHLTLELLSHITISLRDRVVVLRGAERLAAMAGKQASMLLIYFFISQVTVLVTGRLTYSFKATAQSAK